MWLTLVTRRCLTTLRWWRWLRKFNLFTLHSFHLVKKLDSSCELIFWVFDTFYAMKHWGHFSCLMVCLLALHKIIQKLRIIETSPTLSMGVIGEPLNRPFWDLYILSWCMYTGFLIFSDNLWEQSLLRTSDCFLFKEILSYLFLYFYF